VKFEWHIEPNDVRLIQNIVAEHQHRSSVADRIERNIEGVLPEINRNKLWCTQMMCLLTSRQRSGPNSPVSTFLSQEPFSLSLQKCYEATDVEALVSSTLSDFGGIRFSTRIAERAAANLRKLESGDWEELEKWVEKLKVQRFQSPNPSHYELERLAANYVVNYKGFGPKQSRDFWQELGLLRYEFVLDARVTDWLRKANFPLPLSALALGDETYYIFLSDILRELCVKADVVPCVFDAAVFSSYDK
jgi:hypothetical protein